MINLRTKPAKMLKIFLSLFLTLILSFGLCDELPSIAFASQNNTQTVTKETLNGNIYVALGDSVPAGYGLANADDCYVKQFSDLMTKNGYSNTMFNYAVSGDTTDDLLLKLGNMKEQDPQALKAIQNANVITINIGGNNVLGPLIKAVNSQLEQQIKSLGITSIDKATSSQLLAIGMVLYNMTLDADQLSEIEKGAQSFAVDFPKIINWMKTNAPSANVIFSTIYNPIPNYLSFYKTSTTLLEEMNKVITEGAKESGYYTADVYSAFTQEKDTQILNLNLGQYKTPISVDIHPNTVGHKLIAEVYSDLFQTIPNIVRTKAKTPVTASITLPGEVGDNGSLTAAISKDLLSSVISKAKTEAKRLGREKDGIAVILNRMNSDVKSLNITFDDSAIDLLKSNGVKNISVNTGILRFNFDKEAIKALEGKTNGRVIFKATPVKSMSKAAKKLIGNRPVYQLVMKDGKGKKIADLGKGKLSLSLRYSKTTKEKTGSLNVVSINSKGQPKLITSSEYEKGWVSCECELISTYGVGYKK